jgi:hypothetical protein
MRRSLAVLVATATLLPAAPALGEPNDVSLVLLGSPSPAVWQQPPFGLAPADAQQQAADARQRFAILSAQMGLALTSLLLEPAHTTGLAGLEIGLDFGYAPVGAGDVGAPPPPYVANPWPTSGPPPSSLLLPALHVRKGLPWSFEIGGRLLYVVQSTMVAAQFELKWALTEGIRYLPDLAVRGAATFLFGASQWNLAVYEGDLILGKRFGVGGVMELTPYGAVRLSWVSGSSAPINFGDPTPTSAPPQDAYATVAAFPGMSLGTNHFWRYTLGLRGGIAVVVLAAECTWFPGRTVTGSSPSEMGAAGYPTYTVPASWSFAGNVGFAF